MTDILIQTDQNAGHITLNRPKSLNALTWDMCTQLEQALDAWASDPEIAVIMIDGAGERAFCAGGDIADLYAQGTQGNAAFGQQFWRDEYRLNAKLAQYPKPVVSFLNGFTMGGGVGVGCHASHRIVGESSQIALPECSIGLVPDVGSTLLLANAPGRCGEYLGLTGTRMDASDAIYAGFADVFVPETDWDTVKRALAKTGDIAAINDYSNAPPSQSRLGEQQADIDALFGADTLPEILNAINNATGSVGRQAAKLMARNAPLGMAVALEIIRAVRKHPHIQTALDHEFRYTFRSIAQGDVLEGIRAAIIDRDKSPRWAHPDATRIPRQDILDMTKPLGKDALHWEESI